MSMHAAFLTAHDFRDWRDADRVVVGASSSLSVEPVASVGVELGSGLRQRIDLFASAGQSCFQDVRCVGEVVYIGYGQLVAVVKPKAGILATHALDGYFGHFFAATDVDASASDLGQSMLVASASELLRFDDAGRLLWRSTGLGVDGVVVHSVRDGILHGDAEWDPPGGWKPFRLHLETGTVVPG